MERLTIGQRLRKFRKEQELTLRNLSELSGIHFNTLSNWELDKSTPSILGVVELADFYGVSIDELIGRTNIKKGYAHEYQN